MHQDLEHSATKAPAAPASQGSAPLQPASDSQAAPAQVAPDSQAAPAQATPDSQAASDQATPDLKAQAAARDHEIIKASVLGIIGNMILVAFKIIIGLASHSIAIILDGVNNATDAVSSVVTIIGTKLAGKRPDKKHPFGYGRIEYLTSVVIAAIILAAGVISLRESILKIMNPGTPTYSSLVITVIVLAILGKIAIGLMFKHYGDKTQSEALVASGIDSNYDAVISAGTLVVAFAQNVWGLNIDGIVGVIISLFVCKAGLDVLRDALAPIIGTPEDKEKVLQVVQYVGAFPNVRAVHDVVFDNFGPNMIIGSLRIMVPEDMAARDIDELSRQITKGLQQKFGLNLTVGIYTECVTEEFRPMKCELESIARETPGVLDVHAFYVDIDEMICYFDIVVELSANPEATAQSVVARMKQHYPAFTFNIQIDTDFSE